jgi:putative membrane protein
MKQLVKYFSRIVAFMWLIIACNANPNSSVNGDSTMSTQNGGDTSANASDSMGVVKTPLSNDANVVINDEAFISKNIRDNEMELELATIGNDRLSTPALKKAAARMKKDHTQMLNDLKTLAAKKQVTVPTTNTAMSAIASLPNTAGKEFDIAWLNQMREMHQAKLTELENVLKQTHDADIKALATKAQPVIKKHIDMLAGIEL